MLLRAISDSIWRALVPTVSIFSNYQQIGDSIRTLFHNSWWFDQRIWVCQSWCDQPTLQMVSRMSHLKQKLASHSVHIQIRCSWHHEWGRWVFLGIPQPRRFWWWNSIHPRNPAKEYWLYELRSQTLDWIKQLTTRIPIIVEFSPDFWGY